MSSRKLDIFDLLRAADRCDSDWFSKQSEDARKEFAPPVVLRWAATVNDGPEAPYMLWVVNERANAHLFDLYKHPDLLYRLIASCGLGSPQRHQWLAAPKRVSQSNPAAKLLSEIYPEANDSEITLLLEDFDRGGFIEFVGECGIQDQDAKEMVAAYDKLFPGEAPVKTKKGKSK